ncbi:MULTISPECIES: putative entry exclusion protein TrbK-alt [Alphaproteobacteria]|uniref:Conjugal transfer protein TrbK n=2 Tax=Alphaproteobacteria TaxID=28211 RepID=A0A2S7J561_9HYPH|nr:MULTISPECIES: putative entry exclusion protein TrbK-alt [Alphaproteobacteria]AMG74224.1 Conjugal transfer protein TrbK [Sphingopyxis granuli]PQA75330.1 conjugal transfer protein TrbK [Brucella oryzae]
MDGKMLARLGAIVFVAAAITATVIELTRKEDATASSPVRLHQPASDPLRGGQRRCQQLGQAAANDADCLRVWAETRDRFLGRQSAPAAPEGR